MAQGSRPLMPLAQARHHRGDGAWSLGWRMGLWAQVGSSLGPAGTTGTDGTGGGGLS